MDFKELHYQKSPLLLANVWDVPSAKAAEKLQFKAIGTSSSAIASMLGYNDGEELTFEELEYVVKRIILNTNLPLSVDIESGYSRHPKEIINHIKKLAKLGVVGINIEDSIVTDKRELLNAADFAKIVQEIKAQLTNENISMFINVRIDMFIVNNENCLAETQRRIEMYENAGADGLFIPCVENEQDIKTVVEATKLPVNVMCMPNLPDFETLERLGVQRISMGNFLFDKMYHTFEEMTTTVLQQKSFKSIF